MRKNIINNGIKVLCLLAIIIWPIYNSFLGLDLVDTGYYLYQYDTPLSPYGTYTTYLATLIGAVWLKIFPGLGLWGLNLLEILLEWATCIVVYQTFKTKFGKITTLCGIAITMLGISTYVNIFNYHQLNMALCCMMLCFMYMGLTKKKKYLLFISGCMGALAITCRMPSVLTLVCVLCIVYWHIWESKSRVGLGKNIWAFISGYVVIGILVIAFLYCFQLTDIIIGEIFRINDLGSTGSASYGTSSIIINLIRDTFCGILAALLFTVCVLFFAVIYEWGQKRRKTRYWILGIYILVMIPAIYAAVYIVGQAPPFGQLTSFSWFLYGMCVEICLYYMIKGIMKPTEKYAEDGTIAMMAIALIFLCLVGSAARAKNVILGLWIITPFIGNKIKEIVWNAKKIRFPATKKLSFEKLSVKSLRAATSIILISATICFGHFIITTNNFDSTDRSKLTAKIESNKVKYIKTTKREAEAVNGVLKELNNQDRELLVVGNGVEFYYLAGLDSYVRPWVSGTSYTYDKLYADLKERVARSEKRPIVLICKTDPYEGFELEDYEALKIKEANNKASGKKDLIYEFMDVYGYEISYENDYFIIYEPDSEKEMEIWEL